MARLVAIDLPGGEPFTRALEAVWGGGDAAFVVDRRLTGSARRDLLALARPHRVIGGGDGQAPDPTALPLTSGDALVVATSGSTGTPKLVVHTFDGLVAHARAVHGHLAVDADRDRWLACLPLAHLGGLGVVVRALLTGTPVDVLDGFDADRVASAPTTLGSTLVSVVPTALDRIDPGAYRWVVLGGAADPGPRPANVVRTYGLTETGGGVVYDGRPIGDTEVALGDDGAVRLRGSTLARGLRSPDGTVAPITDDDGWLTTGDRGRWDGDRLVVDGRADDLIVTGGENVWPAPVEAVLVTTDGATIDGILAERDVVLALSMFGPEALDRPVADVMSTEVVTCRLDTTVEELMATMTERRARHVPVVVDGHLAGVVSIGDVVKDRISWLEFEAQALHDYISHPY